MNANLLGNESLFPSDEVLQSSLGEAYAAFKEFIESITSAQYGLTYQWRYYKDGHSWLCKVTYKKKTVLWVSIWSGYFKAGFYFTEKTVKEILALDISTPVKEQFKLGKPIGKLKPLIIDVHNKEQLGDIYSVISFKKSLA